MNELKFLQKLSVKDSVKMMEVLVHLVNQKKIDSFGAEKGFIFNEHEQRNISGIILDITDYILKETEFPVKPQKEPYTVGTHNFTPHITPEDLIEKFAKEGRIKHSEVKHPNYGGDALFKNTAIPGGDYPPEVGHIPPPPPYIYGVLCNRLYNLDIDIWSESRENETGAKYIPLQSLDGLEKNYIKHIIKHQSWDEVTSDYEKKKFQSDNNLYFKIPVSDWNPLMNPPFDKFTEKATEGKSDSLTDNYNGRLWALSELSRRIDAQLKHGTIKTVAGFSRLIADQIYIMTSEIRDLQKNNS